MLFSTSGLPVSQEPTPISAAWPSDSELTQDRKSSKASLRRDQWFAPIRREPTRRGRCPCTNGLPLLSRPCLPADARDSGRVACRAAYALSGDRHATAVAKGG